MLIDAALDLGDDPASTIDKAIDNENTAYIHAHNAAHGCFVARIDRAD